MNQSFLRKISIYVSLPTNIWCIYAVFRRGVRTKLCFGPILNWPCFFLLNRGKIINEYLLQPNLSFQAHVPFTPRIPRRAGPSRGVLRPPRALAGGAAALALGGRRVGGGWRRRAAVP